MSKADRVLEYFPGFFRAWQQTKLLRAVVGSLAAPLEEADTLLFRIQRAHRINVAEHAEDIVHLASALNLDQFHFEDILIDESLGYDQRLDLMRQRVRRIARVHLAGLGTPWAVMEAAAIFLNAAIVPERTGDPLLKHLDPEGYSHKAVLEFSGAPEKPREPLYLFEAPLLRQKIEPVERWPLDSWPVVSRNAERSPVRIVIQGMGERTVRPTVFCPDTQEGIVFNGLVPDGKTLVIDAVEGASLENEPVGEWVTYYRGGIAGFSRTNQADFVTEESRDLPPFDSDLESLQSNPFTVRRTVPAAPSGTSEWRFQVAAGVYDGADFDYSALGTPSEPIGSWDGDFHFDQSVFEYPASGIVGMAWDERLACAFKLLLPAYVPRPQPAEEPLSPVSRVAGVMPRFKAAGIQALVDTAKDTWILGSSRLRAPDAADGEGVDFHATRLRNPRTELYVP